MPCSACYYRVTSLNLPLEKLFRDKNSPCRSFFCNLLCIIPPVMMPLNAVTPIFGVPVILYIIIRRRDY